MNKIRQTFENHENRLKRKFFHENWNLDVYQVTHSHKGFVPDMTLTDGKVQNPGIVPEPTFSNIGLKHGRE